MAVLVRVTLLVARQARRRPCLPVGWFWYLGILVPVIGLAQSGRVADPAGLFREALRVNPDGPTALRGVKKIFSGRKGQTGFRAASIFIALCGMSSAGS